MKVLVIGYRNMLCSNGGSLADSRHEKQGRKVPDQCELRDFNGSSRRRVGANRSGAVLHIVALSVESTDLGRTPRSEEESKFLCFALLLQVEHLCVKTP